MNELIKIMQSADSKNRFFLWYVLFLNLLGCFGIELVSCDFYFKRFELTKDLLFGTFFITVWNKLCRLDQSVLEFESFPPLMNWWI